VSVLPRRNLGWLWLSAAAIVLDQLSKYWLARSLALYQQIALMPCLNLVHAHNTGAAFSMMSHAPAAAFIILSVAVSIGIGVWLHRHPAGHRLVAAGLALILGGALGNAIDRIRFGYVVDFVDFHVGHWHFAAFNVADSAITVGAGLLILDMLLEGRRTKSAAA